MSFEAAGESVGMLVVAGTSVLITGTHTMLRRSNMGWSI
jgi:hypothetical protein